MHGNTIEQKCNVWQRKYTVRNEKQEFVWCWRDTIRRSTQLPSGFKPSDAGQFSKAWKPSLQNYSLKLLNPHLCSFFVWLNAVSHCTRCCIQLQSCRYTNSSSHCLHTTGGCKSEFSGCPGNLQSRISTTKLPVLIEKSRPVCFRTSTALKVLILIRNLWKNVLRSSRNKDVENDSHLALNQKTTIVFLASPTAASCSCT